MKPGLVIASFLLAVAAIAAPALSTENGDGVSEAVEAELLIGATLFATVGCSGCHGPEGEGAGIAPAIADNGFTASPGNVVAQVLEGDGAMPPFGGALDDVEVAAIVNFVRMRLNAYTDRVHADFVAIIRGG